MNVYSGEVLMCQTGLPTRFKDDYGKTLYTGDIVFTFKDNYIPDHLTVVVSDGEGPFIMGIKESAKDNHDGWNVLKVKDHSDVVDGEHWEAYGFSFKEG